ncbi:MAG: 30S ribosomal protein S4 [Candidatus Micrarchaeia archaeon]
MGGPRKFKNKYEAPKKLWEKDRLARDRTLRSEYGLKNSREIWIANAELKKYRKEARRLLSLTEEERKQDIEKVFKKLHKYGILKQSSELEDILSLDIREILERRLQTRVLRKGFVRTIRQARQLIAHGFIAVGDKVITIPGYLVTENEDEKLNLCKKIDLEEKVKEEETKPVEKEVTSENPKKQENEPHVAA